MSDRDAGDASETSQTWTSDTSLSELPPDLSQVQPSPTNTPVRQLIKPIDSSYGTTDRTLSETNTWERTIGFPALLELDMGCRMAFLDTSMRM